MSDISDVENLSTRISSIIKEKFNLDIPIFIILEQELEDILCNAPSWWGNDSKEIYDNLIFMIPPLTYEELYGEIGEVKSEYERIFNYKCVVFWLFSRKDYQKTNWYSKTANTKVANVITIRTAGTVRKIVSM